MKPTLLKLHSIFDQFKSAAKKVDGFVYGVVLYLVTAPSAHAQSTFSFSTWLCNFGKLFINTEVFLVIAVLAAGMALIVYKMTKDTKILVTMLGIAIAAFLGANLPTVINTITGKTMSCAW